MKPRQIPIILLAALLTLTFSLPALAAPEGALTLTDMAGRELVFDAPVQRLVVLQASDVEILYAIGAEELLVGRGEYANYPAEALELPSVQSGFETNFEQIIALKPDVVVMTMMSQREEDTRKLADAGIKTVVSNAQTTQGVYDAITMLGRLSSREEAAAALVQSMQEDFAELAEKASQKEGGSVYFEVSPLQFGLWTAGKGTFMDEIATLLNLSNACGDMEGWQSVSEEQILQRNPDIIITTAMYFGEGLEPVEEVLSRANWNKIDAVQNMKVFNADSDAITRPGPRLVEAAQALFNFIYGE